MKKLLSAIVCFFSITVFGQKNPEILGHQFCASARVVCNITDQPNESPLCNASCSGNNNLVNGTNSCFSGGLTRWGFYIFTINQSGKLTFDINPSAPGFFDCGDYNFALFDVTNGCGSIGNAIRCSIADDGCTGSNTGLNMTALDTTEGTGGDGWNKYLNAVCGHTYLLCLDIPGNDGNGFSLSFGGTCTFGVPVDFTATPDTVCAGQPVNFALNCYTPNAFITYNWNFGPNATPLTFSGSTPPPVTFSTTGLQTISVTGNTVGGNACSSTATQNVFVTAGAPTSAFTAVIPPCSGPNTTVNYTGNASSGASYNWNFGSGTVVSGSGQGPYVISFPSAGTYTMSLDVTECATASGVTTNTITVFPSPTANAGADVSICAGSSTSLSGSGGTQYGWQPAGAGLSCTLCQNPVATPSATTSYTLAVMDANGCTNTDVVNVIVNPVPVSNISSSVNVSCFSGNNGTATVNVTTGSSPFTYQWSNGGTTAQVSNLISLTYSVLITDAKGCTTSQTVSITQPPVLTASVSATNISCFGQSNGSASANASGGTPAYTYFWSPSGSASSSVSGLAAGTNSVLVTDNKGCAVLLSIVIVQPAAISSTLSSVPAGCGMTNGSAVASASGGNLPYTYSWSNGGTTSQISNLSAQTYSVTITDAKGCTHADAVSVTQNPPPVAAITGNTNICDGETTILSASGGTSYLWSTNASTSSITISPATSGSYSVIVTSGNCSSAATVNVVVNALPTVNAGPDVTIPAGSSAQLNATGGGNGFTWSPASGLSCTNCQSPNASPQSSTTYYVTVTDANGCTAVDTVFIFVDQTCMALYLPNAFSPNGDGEDDEWQIYINNLSCITDFKITIWDRWGEKVFQSEDKDFRWDGKYIHGIFNGEEGTAVFVYRMKVEMLSGTKIDKKGNVTVVR